MVKEVKAVKLDKEFCLNYLDKLREIISIKTGLELDCVSYRLASIELGKRIDRMGGFKEEKETSLVTNK